MDALDKARPEHTDVELPDRISHLGRHGVGAEGRKGEGEKAKLEPEQLAEDVQAALLRANTRTSALHNKVYRHASSYSTSICYTFLGKFCPGCARQVSQGLVAISSLDPLRPLRLEDSQIASEGNRTRSKL